MPNPYNWSSPNAIFKIDTGSCSPDHFKNMGIVIYINFCGRFFLLENPGKEEACVNTVGSNPEKYNDTYWTINYLKVFHEVFFFYIYYMIFKEYDVSTTCTNPNLYGY